MNSKKMATAALVAGTLLFSSIAVASADETPTAKPSTSTTAKNPNPVTVAQQAAYKLAVAQYKVALVTNNIAYRATMAKYWADWKVAVTKYEADWQLTLTNFQTLKTAYDAKMTPVEAARKSAVDQADAAFLAAIAGDKTVTGLEAALTAHQSAMTAAETTYKAAVTALGAAPVRPTKPAELVKPALPTKPVDPVKPVAPGKQSGENNNGQNNNKKP